MLNVAEAAREAIQRTTRDAILRFGLVLTADLRGGVITDTGLSRVFG